MERWIFKIPFEENGIRSFYRELNEITNNGIFIDYRFEKGKFGEYLENIVEIDNFPIINSF